jgi:hypothetical protein
VTTPPNIEHLKLIQAVVTRMAGNSFLLKGWSVTLIAGLSALAKAQSDRSFAWIALGVVIVLALLDSYFLCLERAYRKLYDDAVAGRAADWSLTVKRTRMDVLSALRSVAIAPLYTALAAGAIAVALSS